MSSAPPAGESTGKGVPPVFVGGAPRSGTHIVAHLIGAHPRYFVIPYEVSAHADWRVGIPAYLRGSLDRDELIDQLRTFWWRSPLPWRSDLERGLFKLIEPEDLEAALAAFRASAADDRLSAARALARALFEVITARSQKPGWVEHSPLNLSSAPDVLALFPEAKLVHVVRDGRDRACSVVQLPFGADSFPEALARWARVLRRGEAMAELVPSGQFLVLQLEDLVLFDRERSYERLLEFLTLPDDPAMRSFFDSEAGPERAHVGRWQTELPEPERVALDAEYREVVDALRADGISCVPPDRELDFARGPGAGTRSSVDPWAGGRGGEDL
jgi:sulfotransferase family protein